MIKVPYGSRQSIWHPWGDCNFSTQQHSAPTLSAWRRTAGWARHGGWAASGASLPPASSSPKTR